MANFIHKNKLQNTRILLIGGTSGIGFAIARAALENEASVILASSKPEKVANAVSRLKDLYPEEPYISRIAGQTVDLSNEKTMEDDIVSLFEFAAARDTFPGSPAASSVTEEASSGKVPINHIVITAGAIPRLLPPTDPGVNVDYLKSLNTVRVIGAALIAKHAPTYMPASHLSSITFTTGAISQRPMKGFTLAVSIATAVEGLAKGLAVDLAPIRVNTVLPGPVRTEIFDVFGDKDTVDGILAGHAEKTLVKKVGDPDELAETYLALIKDSFVTGIMVRSDGGMVAF
ncbi:oxidoreductase, short chain dehydrogenase/reductase family [Aspergillus lucknowensis]|uniref:Uncharacterized protein n=1 Tax=Aspergillus lucknowensis TaxID=176173 RepID=A0ABR4M0D1_9EURO